LLCGCAQTAKFQVWRPAELDVAGIQRLAVLDFRGESNSGQMARSDLVARLWESGFYDLVDPTELNAVVRTSANDTEGDGNIAGALDVGRRLGVDAILVGRVVRYRAVDELRRERGVHAVQTDPRSRELDRATGVGGVGYHDRPFGKRDVYLALSFELIDVRTGQVRARREASYRADEDVHNGQGYLPAKEAVIAEMTERWAKEMSELLTPHLIPYETELATATWGGAAGEIRRGNSHATNGNWEKAALFYQTALTLDSKSDAAMYNLALARAARFDYPEAVRLLNDAVQVNPRSQYRETLARIERHQQAYQVAVSQKRSQASSNDREIAMPPRDSSRQ
jgi:hypothetical protein